MAFAYYRPISIPSDGTERTDYPVKVSLTTANFGSGDATDDFPLLKADGSDIRFFAAASQNGTPLKHWIESYNADDETAEVWVKVPTLPASGGTTLYLFYDDAAASDTSAGADVFDLFFQGVASLEETTLPNFTTAGLGNSTPIIEDATAGATREPSNVLYDFQDSLPNRRYKIFYGGTDSGLRMAFAATPSGPWTKENGGAVVLADTEDAFVIIKPDGSYLMLAEDRTDGDQENIRYFTSTSLSATDWVDEGLITLRDSGGTPKSPHNAQSPTIWLEGSTYYLLYEAYPDAPQTMRLATSSDGIDWQDVQSAAVMTGSVDNWLHEVPGTIVPDDIRKLDGTYYLTYHTATNERGSGVATSTDLLTWTGRGEIHCDDPTRSIVGTAMFVPDEDNAVTVAPIAVICSGQTSLDPDVFNPGLLYKQICRDTQTLSGWTSDTGGAGGTVDFINGLLRLNPAQDSTGQVWIESDDAPLVNNFAIEVRRWVRSPRFPTIAVGAGAVAPANGTSNWFAAQPGSGFRLTHAQGTNFQSNPFFVKADASNNQTIINTGGGGLFTLNRYFQTARVYYHDSGTLRYTLDGTQRATGTDTTWNANSKRLVLAQGEQSGTTTHNGGTQYVQWAFARQFYNADPTVTVGDRENAPAEQAVTHTIEAAHILGQIQAAGVIPQVEIGRTVPQVQRAGVGK